MKTYHFTCEVITVSGHKTCKGFDIEAERFDTAYRLLLREAKSRRLSLSWMYPRYKVVNESGKISYRLVDARYLVFRDSDD